MSVKAALLALLGEESKYGYQLRAEFEERTGALWPLNVGQVYSTLTRLERDGLIEEVDGLADEQAEPQRRYRITASGREEVLDWFASAVPRGQPARDELAIKLALAVTTPSIDAYAVLRGQRATTMSALQALTQQKRQLSADPEDAATLAWSLVLDSVIFEIDAELRWLDHCEARLRRMGADNSASPRHHVTSTTTTGGVS